MHYILFLFRTGKAILDMPSSIVTLVIILDKFYKSFLCFSTSLSSGKMKHKFCGKEITLNTIQTVHLEVTNLFINTTINPQEPRHEKILMS